MTSTNACSALLAPSSVVIVGCFGRMLFREAGSKGYGVRGIDKPFDDLEPLSRASLVIVCIPAAFFEETLHRLCPHMREDAILCDITSVKVAPMQQMENISSPRSRWRPCSRWKTSGRAASWEPTPSLGPSTAWMRICP